jgi:hypothetical protein
MAQAIFQQRLANLGRDWPPRHCLPVGPSSALVSIYRIVQSPTVVALLVNSDMGDNYRQIFLDGRELPKDPSPTWHGYSVGRWEKSESGKSEDTLVVETAGFNDRSWLDMAGHPHSESLRVTERFRRVDFGHLQIQVTFDDPVMMTRPLTAQQVRNYLPDRDMLEGICEDRDAPHLVGKATEGVKLSEAVLAKYAGTYELSEADPGLLNRRPFTISLANGQLYLGALRLIPQSETNFQWFDGTAFDFSLDAAGNVTGVRRDFGEDRAGFFRKR